MTPTELSTYITDLIKVEPGYDLFDSGTMPCIIEKLAEGIVYYVEDQEHFTESSIDHVNIQSIGVNTHVQIDTHIALVNEHIAWTSATQNLVTTGNVTCNDLLIGDNRYIGPASAPGLIQLLFGGGTVVKITEGFEVVQHSELSSLDVNSYATFYENVSIKSGKELRFFDVGNSNYEGFEAPALTSNQMFVLPVGDGNANEAWATDGGGNLIWRTHDELAGYVANEHIDWTNATQNFVTTGTLGCGAITTTGNFIGPDGMTIGVVSDTDAVQIEADGDVLFSQDIITSQTASVIRTNSSDGADNKSLNLAGGGALGSARGAVLRVNGNEVWPGAGTVYIAAGNVADGDIHFYTGNWVLKMRIARDGNIIKAYDTILCGGSSPTLTIANGSITDGSGAISFGNETLSTTGTMAASSYLIGANTVFDITGIDCTLVGVNALNNTGDRCTFVGDTVGNSSCSGNNNTALGHRALDSILTGTKNLAIGTWALQACTNGGSNVGIGHYALYSLTSGDGNFGLGEEAMRYITTTDNSLAIGRFALYRCTQKNNVGIGYNAGYYAQAGLSNTYIGADAHKGTALHSGQKNTVIGHAAGFYKNGGDFNILIGDSAGIGTGAHTMTETVAIGSNAGNNGGTNRCVYIGHEAGYRNATDDRLIFDNQVRADAATELINSIIHGDMAAAPADQILRLNAKVFLTIIKSGATQAGAGAAASEIWKTSSHASLPDNVLMIGV